MIAGPNRIWQNNLLLFPLDIIAVRQIRQFFLGKIVFHAFIVYIVIRLIKGNIELRETSAIHRSYRPMTDVSAAFCAHFLAFGSLAAGITSC